MDLRQFVRFCGRRQLGLSEIRRSDVEPFGRELEAKGRAPAMIARRLCTVTGFYRYAVEEGLIAHSPAVHVRGPRIDYESTLSAWTATKSAPCSSPPPSARQRARSDLAPGAQRPASVRSHRGRPRSPRRRAGHRTLTVLRQGGKTVTIPLAARTACAVDLAVGERCDGPVFTTRDGRRLDRHGAARIVRLAVAAR